MNARAIALAAGAAVLTGVLGAAAEPMDPALERLVVDPSCRTAAGEYIPGGPVCRPDHVAFKKLTNELGFAFAPAAMHAARTTGYGGFDVSIQADYTKISNDADYWKRGTQGSVDASSNRAPSVNESPASLLQLYSVKISKGFGFGLELAATVGFMPQTSMFGGGADVRLALLEGFRTGLGGIFPDVAVGGGVRTVTGTPQLLLTVAGLDAQISKPLPIQDASVLTPWVGYQHLWIFANSGLIDLTPGTDAQGQCGYAGQNVPGNPDPAKPGQFDGQPICTATGPDAHIDFNNNAVFEDTRLERHRLLAGLSYRYEVARVGLQFATDITKPADAQSSEQDKAELEGEDRQWTFSVELGASF